MTTEHVTDLTRGVYRRLYSGFITGKRINKLSLGAEAWFWRVLVTVDDFGNGRADPDLCRSATQGLRKVTARQVSGWLREMKDAGLIRFYAAKGEPYFHIVGFEAAQPSGKNGRRIRRCEPPVNPGESKAIQGNPDAVSASEITNEITNDSEDEKEPLRSTAAPVIEIFDFWKVEMNHPKAQLTADRKKKIEERLKDSTVDEIKTAIVGCKASDFHMGREPGKPAVFDDIELICRKRSKLEFFIAKAENPNGTNQSRPETASARNLRANVEYLRSIPEDSGRADSENTTRLLAS